MARAEKSEATRAAIVAAARRQFAKHAYNQVGLRDIAAAAGVDKRVLTRHFGTKANLFAEALASAQQSLPGMPAEGKDPIEAGMRLVFEAGRMSFEERNDYISLCLQSASSTEAKGVVRKVVEAEIADHAATMTGPEAAIRAAMALSVLFGVSLVREIIEASPIAGADAEVMVRHTAPILRRLISGAADPD